MERQTAAERLAYGDTVIDRQRVTTPQAIACADSLSTEFVAKALWLARVYPEEVRASLGADLLSQLTPSQLEVVAKLDPPLRKQLLRRAASEGLSVRQLRVLAREHVRRPGVTTVGGLNDLVSARRALETYAQWAEPDLDRLLGGPNGELIRDLAVAGSRLAARLEGGTRSTPT